MQNWENKIKWGLIIGLVALAGTYIYLLNDSVFAVANRSESAEKIADLNADVSSLEVSYLGQITAVNLDLVGKLGFVDAIGSTGFAVKSQPANLLAINNEI